MEHFKKIKIRDLDSENISIHDMDSVIKLAKSLMWWSLVASILLFIPALSFPIEVITLFTTFSTEGITATKIGVILFSMGIAYLFYIFAYRFFITRGVCVDDKTPKHSKYGTIYKKDISIDRDDNGGFDYKHYIYVSFPKDETRLKRIYVHSSDYYSMKEGFTVLVVSFDGRRADIIQQNTNKTYII